MRIKSECLVNDYSFDTDADYLKISDDGGGKSGRSSIKLCCQIY
ncbi:MAG: hypothetical protein ACLS9K_06990 [Lachnospira eligens]